MKRNMNESFEEYKIRRKNSNKIIKEHLKGVPIITTESNRQQKRSTDNKTKHNGSQNKIRKTK